MTSAERTEVLVTARLLRATARVQWLSIGLTLLAVAALLFGTALSGWAFAAIIFGLAVNYLGFRIAFDGGLFADAGAQRLTAADLDVALASLGLSPERKAGRSWSERCRGAKRLIVRCGITLALQMAAMIVLVLTR